MTLGTEVLVGGIIAAGEGRRLRQDGFSAPKPLVSVAGVPLLEGVVRNFLAANIVSLTVIVNESERECVEWAAARFPTLDVRFIVRTTASSLESFTRVLAAAPPGPLVVSTVDAQNAMDQHLRTLCQQRIGGARQQLSSFHSTYADVTEQLALMPVWLAHYSYGGNTYALAIHGASGQVVGDRPYSKSKIGLLIAAIVVAVLLVLVLGVAGFACL